MVKFILIYFYSFSFESLSKSLNILDTLTPSVKASPNFIPKEQKKFFKEFKKAFKKSIKVSHQYYVQNDYFPVLISQVLCEALEVKNINEEFYSKTLEQCRSNNINIMDDKLTDNQHPQVLCKQLIKTINDRDRKIGKASILMISKH